MRPAAAQKSFRARAGPRGNPGDPKLAQDGTKQAPRTLKELPRELKMAQHGTKKAQEGPRVAPGCSKRVRSFFENSVPVEAKRLFSQNWFHEGPEWAQDGPKMDTRGLQEGSENPTWAQEVPKWAPRMPKNDSRGPKNAQDGPQVSPSFGGSGGAPFMKMVFPSRRNAHFRKVGFTRVQRSGVGS